MYVLELELFMFQSDLDVEIVSCFEDCFIMVSLTLNFFMFNHVMLGFNGQTRFQWFRFRMGFSGLFRYISSQNVGVFKVVCT
jgi:hypothetical protein